MRIDISNTCLEPLENLINSEDTNTPEYNTIPSIDYASLYSLEELSSLVSAKADVNTSAEIDGLTPLVSAIQDCLLPTVAQLLECHANVNLCADDQNISPLIVASCESNLGLLTLLVDAGADVNHITEEGVTAVYTCAEIGFVPGIHQLLENKADSNVCTTHGLSPVNIAFQRGHCEVVHYLLAHDTNFMQQDSFGRTLLHYGIDYIDILHTLLDHIYEYYNDVSKHYNEMNK